MILLWTTNHTFNPKYSLEILGLASRIVKNKKGSFSLGLLVFVLILENRKSWSLFSY